MSADPSWQADPFARHELRYWDGAAWTAYVSDAGVQASDEPTLPSDGAPPPPPAAAAPVTPAAGGSWKDKLRQAAQQGRELAEKGKAELAKQQAARASSMANDPDTLWVGEKKSVGTSAIGVSSVRYRITRDKLHVESGLLSSIAEQVPLWAVLDVDVRQNVMQRGSDIGDVVVTIDTAQFPGTASAQVLLDNIEGPHDVRDLLNRQVGEARAKKQMLTQTQYLQHTGPAFGAAPASEGQPGYGGGTPATGAPIDLADQLRKLAELRNDGILSDDEFALQKQRLLGT